ncbi:hypothetical protein [Chryseobacterium sp.]|uniref:hypothetical protein n=1 Tax=Chryseobacterium sp. TaxID=1871047 RepID=UPI0025C479BA|nr:hypothetical protein [Chryseobacterium sp.]
MYELGQEKERTYRDIYQPHIKEVNPLTSFIQKLNQKNTTVGLTTMGDQPNIDFILDGLNIRNYFQEITDGA